MEGLYGEVGRYPMYIKNDAYNDKILDQNCIIR